MKKIKKAIKKTAKNNDTTFRNVKTEIEAAITAAIQNPNKTPEAEFFWSDITKNKKRLIPEEIIAAIVEKLS